MKPEDSHRFIVTNRDLARRTQLLWALAYSLVGLAFREAENLGWWRQGSWWALIPAVAAIVFAVRWFVLGRALTTAVFARQLDSTWELQARLESSVELENDPTAFAAAQRSDAFEHARGHQMPRKAERFCGLTVLIVGALLVLGEISWEIQRHFQLSPVPLSVGEEKAPATATQAPNKPREKTGQIIWHSPEAEIKATSIEEIPLAAVAESTDGYKKLTLEIALNGEPRPSQPIDPALLAQVGQPGVHALALSLYLDEIGAQEFDIVSYYLRGEIGPDSPAVVSPLQFVQIRPSREDMTENENEGAQKRDDTDSVNVIRRLKIAQLELMKQNHNLATTPLAHDDPVWRETNTAVAGDQATLATKTDEFRETAIKNSSPSIVVDNLDQAAPLMRDASKGILAFNNEPAGKLQGKSLALITATEKIIQKIRAKSSQSSGEPKPVIQDPFKDQQKYPMPERTATPAGRLEELARKHEQIAHALNENSMDQVSAQSDVSRELDKLVSEKNLDPDVQIEVAAAAKDAAEANRQLAQSDPAAARGPATAAAEALAHAASEQERIGREKALAELDQARRDLNDITQQTQGAERASQLEKLANDLAQMAVNQQRSGSKEAASQLSDASKEMRETARKESAGSKGEADQLAGNQAQQDRNSPGPPSQSAEGTTQSDLQTGRQSQAPVDQKGSSSDATGLARPDAQGDLHKDAPGSKLEVAKNQTRPNSGDNTQPSQSIEDTPRPGRPNGQNRKQENQSKDTKEVADQPSPAGRPSRDGTNKDVAGSKRDMEPLAQKLAKAEAELSGQAAALARVEHQLERVEKELADPANPSLESTVREARLAGQMASALLHEPNARALAHEVVTTSLGDPNRDGQLMVANLKESIHKLHALLSDARAKGIREEYVRRFNPDDFDPAYRSAIDAYFERLSREGAR